MENELSRFERIGGLMSTYGVEVLLALIVMIAGLIAAGYVRKVLRKALGKAGVAVPVASIIVNTFYVLSLIIVIAGTLEMAGVGVLLEQSGMHPRVLYRILAAICLLAIGVIIVFRPFLPTLPFKVGNFIDVGGLLGIVEATTVLNTRLRTFDGKTVFIPNRKILNDDVINYHFTPYRQIRIVVTITYESNLLKAKDLLWKIFSEDPRILDNPAGRVFVINLAENGVELAVRPWVKNSEYWRTRCDLLEIIKLRFDQEGITIAYPQRVIRAAGDRSEHTAAPVSEKP